jgi:hypothetical protein
MRKECIVYGLYRASTYCATHLVQVPVRTWTQVTHALGHCIAYLERELTNTCTKTCPAHLTNRIKNLQVIAMMPHWPRACGLGQRATAFDDSICAYREQSKFLEIIQEAIRLNSGPTAVAHHDTRRRQIHVGCSTDTVPIPVVCLSPQICTGG